MLTIASDILSLKLSMSFYNAIAPTSFVFRTGTPTTTLPRSRRVVFSFLLVGRWCLVSASSRLVAFSFPAPGFPLQHPSAACAERTGQDLWARAVVRRRPDIAKSTCSVWTRWCSVAVWMSALCRIANGSASFTTSEGNRPSTVLPAVLETSSPAAVLF